MTNHDGDHMHYQCVWQKADYFSTVKAKQAISAALFVVFIVYTVFVCLRHKNKADPVSHATPPDRSSRSR